MTVYAWLAALSFLASMVSAQNPVNAVTATVEGRLTTEMPLDAVRVVLNGGIYTAIPRVDGSFKLHAIPPGTYLLEVHDTQSVWPTVRLEVSAAAPGKARALLTHSRQPLPFPLPLEPLVAKPTFFEKREGFQWYGMLANPMVLMMGFTMLIVVVLPKMMANMDPEQLKEMQQMQGSFASMMQDQQKPKISEKAQAKREARARQ